MRTERACLKTVIISQDINWTGVVWITWGLLWCFYQQFGLSFWWHPFTAEDLQGKVIWHHQPKQESSPQLCRQKIGWVRSLIVTAPIHCRVSIGLIKLIILSWLPDCLISKSLPSRDITGNSISANLNMRRAREHFWLAKKFEWLSTLQGCDIRWIF